MSVCAMLCHRAFGDLYNRLSRNELSWMQYHQGLCRVHTWKDAYLYDDIRYVTEQCPDFAETYESAFFHYIHDRFRDRPTVLTPPAVDFVRLFLSVISKQPSVVNATFFDETEQVAPRIACMDAIRSAFYAMTNQENVRVELASRVSPTPSDKGEEEEFENVEISPNDSISQISYPQPRRVDPLRRLMPTPAPSPPRSSASRARPEVPPPAPSPPRSSASRARSRSPPAPAPSPPRSSASRARSEVPPPAPSPPRSSASRASHKSRHDFDADAAPPRPEAFVSSRTARTGIQRARVKSPQM